jgi:hypothetical protein
MTQVNSKKMDSPRVCGLLPLHYGDDGDYVDGRRGATWGEFGLSPPIFGGLSLFWCLSFSRLPPRDSMISITYRWF